MTGQAGAFEEEVQRGVAALCAQVVEVGLSEGPAGAVDRVGSLAVIPAPGWVEIAATSFGLEAFGGVGEQRGKCRTSGTVSAARSQQNQAGTIELPRPSRLRASAALAAGRSPSASDAHASGPSPFIHVNLSSESASSRPSRNPGSQVMREKCLVPDTPCQSRG
jgi:hypothetical protein